jgi:hypothetical protein
MTRVTWRDAALVALLAAGLYISAGTLGAYLARDDFQWLNDARDLGIRHAFVLNGRSHFYRPVVEVWWVGATQVCGARTGCYHLLELLLHVANGILLLCLTARVFGRRDLALASAAIFVVIPSYVEAVVWVCAVTTAFAALWYLLALHFALAAVRGPGARRPFWACVACAAAAMYSHEASVTLFAAIPLVAWAASAARRPAIREAVPFAGLAVALATTTVIANRRNYVFAEGHYAAGTHAVGHALGYLRSIYVGSGSAVELTIVALCVVWIAARGNRAMRAGLLWIIVTMPPYLWFTWGNVGRYTYIPSMGFTWIVAGGIIAARDAIDRRVHSRAPVGVAVATVLVAAVAGRYVAFAQRAIKGEVRWMEAYRQYGDTVSPLLPAGAYDVAVPAPDDPGVEEAYVAPMLAWRTSRPGLQVRFTPRPASSPSRR